MTNAELLERAAAVNAQRDLDQIRVDLDKVMQAIGRYHVRTTALEDEVVERDKLISDLRGQVKELVGWKGKIVEYLRGRFEEVESKIGKV